MRSCKIIVTAFSDSKTCQPVNELAEDTCRKIKLKFSFQLLSQASGRQITPYTRG